MTEEHKETVSAPAGLSGDARRALAEQLVEQAKSDGVSLIGPGGLLTDITKRVLETGLEVELADHLGYEKHAAEGRNGGNSRNGTRPKTVITDVGPVTLEVPRDREGTFEPALVRKRQRRLNGIDGPQGSSCLLPGESLIPLPSTWSRLASWCLPHPPASPPPPRGRRASRSRPAA